MQADIDNQQREPKKPGKARLFIQRAGPFIVSALILYYYLNGLDWSGLYGAMKKSTLWLAVLMIILPQLGMWVTNTVSNGVTMTWFHAPFPYREYFWVRGAAFILQMINNPLAQSGSMIYIQRKTDVTWMKLIGIAGFRVQLGIWGFAILMTPVTLLLHRYGLDQKIKFPLEAWWAFLIFELIFFVYSYVFWHYRFDPLKIGSLIVRDRTSEFWHAFNTATPRMWLITWAILLPQITLVLSGYYFLALSFGIKVPVLEFFIHIPVALAVSNMPLAFGGYGTTTAAWDYFFKAYGTHDNIVAISLFIPTGRLLLRALLGAISLTPAMKEIGSLSELKKMAAGED